MEPELESILDRAEELIKDLEVECENCLKSRHVSERAKNITHEALDKLRIALDHAMRRAWEKHVTPTLSEKDKERARVYFPITSDLSSLHSALGRGSMTSLDKAHSNLYDFLLKHQPFSSGENQWLVVLAKVVAEGKHIHLTPQKRTETRRIKVSGRGGQVSWDSSSVKFGAGSALWEHLLTQVHSGLPQLRVSVKWWKYGFPSSSKATESMRLGFVERHVARHARS